MTEIIVRLKQPHQRQVEFIDDDHKRKVIRAGRRGGKTVGVAIMSVEKFLKGSRILYACPTQDQTNAFWAEVKRSLQEPIAAGIYIKNETEKFIERPGTKQRIKAKTAHDADTLRGDYADVLILDEYQDMDEEAWTTVGAPMLLDNDGDAVFIYTSKIGLRHVKALTDTCKRDTDRWRLFVFTSYDNPYLATAALDEISRDMTALKYRLEIMAEEVEDDPNALWHREMIDHVRQAPQLHRVVIGVDPPGGATECGIVVAGVAYVGGEEHIYVLADYSAQAPAAQWAAKVVSAYDEWRADCVVVEANFGGDMVANTLWQVRANLPIEVVRASRGKALRAEPMVALYQNHAGLHRVHHVGELEGLETEMCSWVPGQTKQSPNRIDALVWCGFSLVVDKVPEIDTGASPIAGYRG